MEQTLVLKGIGVFATLLGIYQWAVSEAEPTDIIFILVVTILLVLMDAEKRELKEKYTATENLNETTHATIMNAKSVS